MRTTGMCVLCICAVLTACASTASAQLVFGSTTTSTSNGAAFYLDINSGVITTLWNSAANKKVNGLAADPITGRLYANDAARLNYWNYGSIGVAPTLIAGMYRTTDFVTFTATGVDGLAFANGNLYGVTSYGSTVYKRGIYQVATTSDGATPTPHCVMTPLWLDPTGTGTSSGTLGTGGLEFNPANNLFYITNSADTTGSGGTYTPGVFTIDAFGSGALTKLTDYPIGHTRIDGLAIGNGKLWMTEQDPTNSRINIFPYDLATSTYGTTIYAPLVDGTNRATGACWAPGALPEPASLALLTVGVLVMLRRR
ncbi:MAG TPA: hypothetical protein VMV94_03245 [Phycisphaerae bacterium]|nr:hypothetical protein [Phycisphaerae bacterium]